MGKNKNLENIKLQDIELGNADGEKEAFNKNFEGYFYTRHSDYELLKNNYDKFIISGKKGTGKTYLAKFLENKVKEEGVLSKTIKWSDININAIIELNKAKIKSDSEIFYKYIILIEMARIILETSTKKILFRKKNKKKQFFNAIGFNFAKAKLKKFYHVRYPEGNYAIKQIRTKDRNLEKVDVNASLKGLNTATGQETEYEREFEYREKNAYEIISELEKIIYRCLRYVPIVLISDDLDEQGLNTLSNLSFKNFLINYLNAANNLNTKIKKYSSKVIIAIRDDILDTLNSQSSNINKLIIDSTIQIDWCEKLRTDVWEYDISKMIINKIRVSANIDAKVSDKNIYLKFFGNRIDNNTQIDYLINRSLGRPRDIIVYLNKIKERYSESEKFSPSNYRDLAASYSKYFIDEFKNELRIYYDDETIEQIFNLLSSFNKPRFTFNEINNYYKINTAQFDKLTDLKSIISRLYKISLLGNDSSGAVSFYYRQGGKNEATFNDDSKFIIHYGAKKALISQKRRKKAKQK